jgi:flagellin
MDIFLGNGDGSFKASLGTNTLADPDGIEVEDIDGDGNLDVILGHQSNNVFGVYLGKGDGTFEVVQSFAAATNAFNVVLGDYNEDGALDVASAGSPTSTFKISLSNTAESIRQGPLDLRTSQRAKDAMQVLDDTLIRINQELGAIGAAQSRLSVAAGTLSVGEENFTAAASRIVDVDVAFESARLVRSQILQQAGAAILGQANQGPALALSLIGFA